MNTTPADNLSEQIEILDKFGQKSGKVKSRKQIHLDSDWHASAHIYIVNQQNQVLLQRRSMKKLILPGMLACPVGGHISAGSDPIATAIKEAEEEANLKLTSDDLKYLGIGRAIYDSPQPIQGLHEREFIHTFIYEQTGSFDVNHKNEEVDGFYWLDLTEFKQMVRTKSDKLIPCWIIYEMVIDYLEVLRGHI